MPATKRGIYHNLKESKYTVTNGEIMFFFSSRLYLTKFLESYQDNRDRKTNQLFKQGLETPLNFDILVDISLYKSLEKRGFYVWLKGVEISCEELHRYALRKMIDKSMHDWYETQRPKLEERLKIME